MCYPVCHLIDANVDTAYFRSIARLHDRLQFPVSIGSIRPTGPLQNAMEAVGVPTFSLETTRRTGYLRALTRLVSHLKSSGTRLVHAHCFDPTVLGLLAARRARIPFVFTRHHSDHNIRLGKVWHTRVDAWCARNADAVIAVSEATRTILVEAEGIPAERVSVVSNGIEAMARPTEAEVSTCRAELELGQEPILLILARLHEEKGLCYLLDALPQVIAVAGPVRVLLAGEGAHRGVLEERVRALGLQGTVRFLGRRKDVATLMELATIVVVPSLAESFGFVPLEAMGLGRPVVATRVGGIPEVVCDGETGLLVPPANAQALADAISRLLRDPGLAASLGKAGPARAAKFSFAEMMTGYEAVYQRVLRIAPTHRYLDDEYARFDSREPVVEHVAG